MAESSRLSVMLPETRMFGLPPEINWTYSPTTDPLNMLLDHICATTKQNARKCTSDSRTLSTMTLLCQLIVLSTLNCYDSNHTMRAYPCPTVNHALILRLSALGEVLLLVVHDVCVKAVSKAPEPRESPLLESYLGPWPHWHSSRRNDIHTTSSPAFSLAQDQ